jgi:hypothetical protein
VTADGRVQCRRAIEALRSGVPNRDAVSQLGSAQPAIEERFSAQLEALGRGDRPRGLLIRGDFGTGKSHVLERLQHIGRTERLVTSKIVISKETPLHDPAKVFRTAVASAIVPDLRGAALAGIAAGLDLQSPAFDELSRWADSDEARLNERFAATLYLYRHSRMHDPELADRIVRFWSGDPIGVAEIKRKLREVGEAATWALPTVKARDLALQRFSFAARLIRAAGYGGWVLLFDEAELIGRYSLLQRGKSYAEIARWLVQPPLGVTAVMAITQDFEEAVIDGKRDDEVVPYRLQSRGEEELSRLAEQGMDAVKGGYLDLERPNDQVLEATYRKLRELHAGAYDWDPPELARDRERTTLTANMRAYVRRWIYEWDLRRLDGTYEPQIEIGRLTYEYSEEAELERPLEGDAAEEGTE